jgi:competence ComEA-like helix-hairpin-helix protein
MWKRHLFFFFERLEIRAGERRALATLLLLGVALHQAKEHWPSPVAYDAAFYAPILAAFDERNARAAAELAKLDSLYLGLESASSHVAPRASHSPRPPRSAPRPSLPSKPIPINTATVAQLDALPGIGPALAQRIIDYRTEHGPFTSVDDLTKVRGIGPALMEKIRAFVTV